MFGWFLPFFSKELVVVAPARIYIEEALAPNRETQQR
jgi:hypothetical protein